MWPAFHGAHITHLADHLNAALPENYQAVSEQSLQILTDTGLTLRPRPDVTVYQTAQSEHFGTSVATLPPPAWTTTIPDSLYEPEELHAVVIYRQSERGEHEWLGDPVVRMELFSPANKYGGSDYGAYIRNRQTALDTRLILVEIDYLNESLSPIRSVPEYPHAKKSFPYIITISNPHLPPHSQAVFGYGFSVDDPIPTLEIPLLGEESVILDFNKVYHFTFMAGRWGNQVDYAAEPLRLASYRDDDQAKIRARMQAVHESFAEKGE
jgi:hypothetical protein